MNFYLRQDENVNPVMPRTKCKISTSKWLPFWSLLLTFRYIVETHTKTSISPRSFTSLFYLCPKALWGVFTINFCYWQRNYSSEKLIWSKSHSLLGATESRRSWGSSNQWRKQGWRSGVSRHGHLCNLGTVNVCEWGWCLLHGGEMCTALSPGLGTNLTKVSFSASSTSLSTRAHGCWQTQPQVTSYLHRFPKPPRSICQPVWNWLNFQFPLSLCVQGFGDFSLLLSFSPSALTASTAAWARTSPGSGAFGGVGGRGCGAAEGASFLLGREEKRGKAGAATLPSTLPWRGPCSDLPDSLPAITLPQAFVSFSSWAPALRAQLPGKSAFSLAHGASSCARGLQRTWELAREVQLWSPVPEQPNESYGDGAQQSFLASSQVIWMHPECENHCLGKQLKTWAFHLASCPAQLEPPKLLVRAVLAQGSGWGGRNGEELRLSCALWERQGQRGREPTFTEHVVWGRHLASTGSFHN